MEQHDCISILAPSLERLLSSYLIIPTLPYFNPRSLAGATGVSNFYAEITGISIHAPSRERLCAYYSSLSTSAHFNPRSLTGATSCSKRSLNSRQQFQSTLPYGSDEDTVQLAYTIDISIHAPLRERRCCLVYDILRQYYFNPRSLTGATSGKMPAFILYNISIHAPLRERPIPITTMALTMPFQSTLPYGSDATRLDKESVSLEFQSTLPYGSDGVCVGERLYPLYFNPRSLTGATMLMGNAKKVDLFQSTLPYGSDCCHAHRAARQAISIHAPLRERRCPRRPRCSHRRISIHAPLRERPFSFITFLSVL